MTNDPIHEHEGQWFFWNESWADRIGPFENEGHARSQLQSYGLELKYGPTPDRFELGKAYKHAEGSMMKIVGEAETTLWGKTLVAEQCSRHYHVIGPVSPDATLEATPKLPDRMDGPIHSFAPISSEKDAGATQNWYEIPEAEWMTNFS